MKIVKILFAFFAICAFVYAIGPKVKFESPKILDTEIQVDISGLDSLIASSEQKISDLKPENEARIVWADSLHQKTEFVLVYLHGFSASQEEGAPLHTDFAKRYGMNLLLARLEDHGRVDTNSFVNLTPDNYLQSAEDALDIGKKLGKKVIVMSCSTGGTLSAILAAAGEDIHSMIMYSPNIDIYDPMSAMLLYPWGKKISTFVLDGNYNRIDYKPEAQKYWNSVYHTNGIFAVKALINDLMNPETFKKINVPVFLGYYYKDDENQDQVVSVSRMLDFFDQIGTPATSKRKIAFPNAGNHVISSHIMSADIDNIRNKTFRFADEILGLKPVN